MSAQRAARRAASARLLERRHLAPRRARPGGGRRLGVRRRAGALPRAARHRVGRDRAGRLRPTGLVQRRLHRVLLRDRGRPQHAARPAPTSPAGGSAPSYHGGGSLPRRGRALLPRLQPHPRPRLPRRLPVRRAATATTRRVDCNHFRYGQCNTADERHDRGRLPARDLPEPGDGRRAELQRRPRWSTTRPARTRPLPGGPGGASFRAEGAPDGRARVGRDGAARAAARARRRAAAQPRRDPAAARTGEATPPASRAPESAPPRGAAPRPGRDAPALTGTTPDGDAVSARRSTGRGAPTLLAFLTSGCSTCAGFWATLAEPRLPGRASQTVIVTHGAERERPAKLRELAPGGGAGRDVLAGLGRTTASPASPYFVLVDGDDPRRGRRDDVARRSPRSSATRSRTSARVGRRRGPSAPARAASTTTLAAAGIGPDHPSLYPGSAEGAQ